MFNHTVEITENDARRLREWLAYLELRPGTDGAALESMRDKLGRAHIVPSNRVDSRVVTLRSRVVVVDEETWEPRTYTLVHPEHAGRDVTSLSILAPMGLAILGRREGDGIEWDAPGGPVRIRLQEVVYQPEAAGDELPLPAASERESEVHARPKPPGTGRRGRKIPGRQGAA